MSRPLALGAVVTALALFVIVSARRRRNRGQD
jgi:hypothetical protein